MKCNHFGDVVRKYLPKLNIHIPFNSTILLKGFCEIEDKIFGSEMKWKTWKPLKYPSRVELIIEFNSHNRVL